MSDQMIEILDERELFVRITPSHITGRRIEQWVHLHTCRF